jgi:2OG-Fe(II) oxygenase superfamily
MPPADSSRAEVQDPGIPQLLPKVRAQADAYRETFLHAQPFKHLSIDDFFAADFAERLLAEFPRFDPELARNEMGKVAGKAVNTKIREISPAYQELYETIGGKPFLELMSKVSGIPDLILDPRMYGGGTHENLHGQELDTHVDFNYDEAQQLHRRLNVIVYLNKGWQPEWGGQIEVHSNPRDPETNQIRSFDPIFNRCVMFETNEISWHGFPKITLPPDQRHQSRKSISIYLYTKTRPAEEIAPVHGTFYVQRPLPERFREGMTLTGEDVAELKNLLWRRDIWVEHYQKLELQKNRELDAKSADVRTMMANYDALTVDAKAALAAAEDERRRLADQLQAVSQSLQADNRALEARVRQLEQDEAAAAQVLEVERRNVRVPVTGYAVQSGDLSGVHSDLWTGPRAEFGIEPKVRTSRIRLHGWRPENSPQGKLRVSVGLANAETTVSGGLFSIELPLPQEYREAFRVMVQCDAVPQMGSDPRELSFKWVDLEVLHPPRALIGKAFR